MGVFSTSEILSASCFNFSTMRPGVMVLLTVCLERESRRPYGTKSAILSFDLGPRSSVAKSHMYFSAEYPGLGGAVVTVYTVVSERATQILVEKKGSDAVQMLYAQARVIQNPSFFGWVVVADYFSRCMHNNLSLLKKGDPKPTKFECQMGYVVEFDCAHLKLLQSYGDSNILRDSVGDLIPTVAGEASSKIGKPLAWNKGGYDVVRVKMGSGWNSSFAFRPGHKVSDPFPKAPVLS
jgi:hypothetical protein